MFKKNDRVLVRSLHDGMTHEGTIRCISVNMAPVTDAIYIVELDQNNPWNSEFEFVAVSLQATHYHTTSSCLTLI
jgi:hypothetical protein